MELRPIEVDDRSLRECADLFAACFPRARHLTVDYLAWMYRDIPRGHVVGFNAHDKGKVVAHYATLPCEVMLGGAPRKALLAILSASHPEYQGQGLFPRLAERTYEHIDAQRYACVYGVGNANSTPSLVRKIGFQLVSPLDVRIGVSALKPDRLQIEQASQFRRVWNADDLNWRCKNTVNPMSWAKNKDGQQYVYANSINRLIKVFSPVYPGDSVQQELGAMPLGLKLFMGLMPRGSCRFREYIALPDFLKPSPLNMVYKPLHTDVKTLDPEAVMFGFQDFDAY